MFGAIVGGTIRRASDLQFIGRGLQSCLDTIASYLQPCASVTKLYNLIPAKLESKPPLKLPPYGGIEMCVIVVVISLLFMQSQMHYKSHRRVAFHLMAGNSQLDQIQLKLANEY